MELLGLPLEKITLNVIKEKERILGIRSLTTYKLFLYKSSFEGKRYLEGIFKELGIEVKMEMRVKDEGANIKYDIFSDENAILIGVEGRTLEHFKYYKKLLKYIYKEKQLLI